MTILSTAVEEVQRDFPLPRCKHGHALMDHAEDLLEPPCGCMAEEATEKAKVYYQAATRKQRPEWVPSSILIPRTVRGDAPVSRLHVKPGRYVCESNQYGALSVKTKDGSLLGIKPDECEPLTWKPNPHIKKKTGGTFETLTMIDPETILGNGFCQRCRTGQLPVFNLEDVNKFLEKHSEHGAIVLLEKPLRAAVTECPYCHKPVKEDDKAVNGICVSTPPGCTFCDPTLAFPTYFVTVTSHEFGSEEFERDSFEEAKQLIDEIIANVTDDFTRHFFITGTSVIEDDSVEFESLYARRFTGKRNDR